MNTSNPAPEPAASALYRAVWRWHFYAGLICLPFLFLMAVTGGLYLFSTEIESIVYRDRLHVNAAGNAPLAPEAIVGHALAAVPGVATRYTPPASATRSAEVGVASDTGTPLTVYVDPYSGRVLGQAARGDTLMEVVKQLHSLAIAGPVANHLVEIVAGWAIVLVVTGTWLWWPRGRRDGVVSVRGRPGLRVWWRDLHAVTGAFAGVAVLFLAVTGMPWSAFWGDKVGKLTNAAGIGLPEYLWEKVPQSAVTLAQQGDSSWTLSQSPVPQSAAPQTPGAGQPGAADIGLNAAVAALEALHMQPGYSLALPADERGVYTASIFPADVHQERVLHLDRYSGQPLVDVGYADYGLAGKATEWGVTLHTGKQFGLVNQLVMLAACIAIAVLAVSSAVMWWKRRPAGQLGAPQRRDGERVARGALLIALLLGLLYPLLGASMLLAVLLEALLPWPLKARLGL